MGKFTVNARDDQREWVDKVCHHYNMSVRRLFEVLMDAAIASDWEPDKSLEVTRVEQDFVPSSPDLSDKEKFIEGLRQYYDKALAAEKAGVSVPQVNEWLKSDRDFFEACQSARALHLAEAEYDLKEVGAGRKSGNSAALTSFLAANHPGYGSPRKKAFDQIFGDLIDNIAEHAKHEFSTIEGGPEAVKRFVKAVLEDTKFYRNELPD